METFEVPEEWSILFESVLGPPTHIVNLSHAFYNKESNVGTRAREFTLQLGTDKAEFADVVGSWGLPRVDQPLALSKPRLKGLPSLNTLGVILDAAGEGPRSRRRVEPGETNDSKGADVVRRVKAGEAPFTTHARALPVPDAIVQSDWHGQVAPTCQGGQRTDIARTIQQTKRDE
jgi:hypothetical protein